MQDLRWFGLDFLIKQRTLWDILFCFLSQLAYNSEIVSKFVSKSNKHNNGTIYIQFFTLYRTAVNVILRLLFFVCKNSWKGNFQELSPLPTDYGYSYAAAFGKLFGTFLLWYPIQNADSAILMNMSTYFLCYSLFSSALIMLLDRFYITKRRVWTHIILGIIFSTLSGVVLFLLPSGIMQKSLYLL